MEKFEITSQSLPMIKAHLTERNFSLEERSVLYEIEDDIERGKMDRLAWYSQFGSSIRQMLYNIRYYRQALKFGFTEISFGPYGWFKFVQFLDFEEIKLELSSIRIGRGPNGTWAYALDCQYGTAGSSGPLSVYCKQFPDRASALDAALDELKAAMNKHVGDSDTTNFKQDVIKKTLKAIAALEVSRVQLSLF